MPIALSACPACGLELSQSQTLFECVSFNQLTPVLRCVCGLSFKQLIPDALELRAHYEAHYYTHDGALFDVNDSTARAERASAEHRLSQISTFMERDPRSIQGLDYGCGNGSFVAHARHFGFDMQGMDPFLPPRPIIANLLHADLDSLEANQFDLITMLNVAEHLSDAQATFKRLRRALKPGGALFLSCPWGDSFAARRFGPRWGHLALDEHLLFWTPRSLDQMCRALGFAGPSKHWIGGSPFPLGKVPLKFVSSALLETSSQHSNVSTPSPITVPHRRSFKRSLLATIGALGRQVQANPMASGIVRQLMHHGRLGDYLAYVIRA